MKKVLFVILVIYLQLSSNTFEDKLLEENIDIKNDPCNKGTIFILKAIDGGTVISMPKTYCYSNKHNSYVNVIRKENGTIDIYSTKQVVIKLD